jgi:subtilisin family serine protease
VRADLSCVSRSRIARAVIAVAGVIFVLAPAASAAPPRVVEAFADPAFGWRDVSGDDLRASLVRSRWARVVVALRPAARHVGDLVAPDRIASVKGRVLRGLGRRDFRLTASWSEIPAFAGWVTRAGLARLTADPDVLKVDLDVGGRIADAQSLPLIKGDAAHGQGFLGSGATVAVIDSGVDAANPDLVGRVVDEHCFCTNANGTGCCQGEASEAAGAGSAQDDNGHGTNVGGIIASAGATAPEGVAPAAKLVAVKVVNAQGSFGSTSELVSALNWVMGNHPEVKVVNMSLGTTAVFSASCDSATAWTLALASAINTFRSRGGLVFVASGNAAAKSAMSAPACVASAVAVGAVYDANLGGLSYPDCVEAATTADQVTCFSNSSPALDLLAPGALITSTGLGGTLSTMAGTSQACPHAAGAAAVLFAASATASADLVEQTLKLSGKSLTDVANGRVTPRIDLLAALDALDVDPPPPLPPPFGNGTPPTPVSTFPPPPPLPPPAATGSGRRPQIDVAPARLRFARIRARGSATGIVTIRNVGDLALRVDALLRLAAPFSFANYSGSFTVPRGGSARVRVVFHPRAAGRFQTTLVVRSNDPRRAEVSIQLAGAASRR